MIQKRKYTYDMHIMLYSKSSTLTIGRRNQFQETGSKVPEPVPKPGTRNRFLNIVWLTHCIVCVFTRVFVRQ